MYVIKSVSTHCVVNTYILGLANIANDFCCQRNTLDLVLPVVRQLSSDIEAFTEE